MPSTPDLRVMASAAFKEAYLELVARFEQKTGHRIHTTWVSSIEIIKNLKAGVATDLIVLAAQSIDELIMAQKLAAGSRQDLATSYVAVAVRQGDSPIDVSSTETLKKALLEAPSIAYSTGPSGVYLVELFKHLGLSSAIAHKVQEIKGEPVGAVVARGEASIGFQQMCELLPVPGIHIVGPLPQSIEKITTFSTGRHVHCQNVALADQLSAFFKSPDSHAIIRSKGMDPIAL